MEGDSDSSIDVGDGVGMAIGSEGRRLPSAGREALNFEVCDRLLGGDRDLVVEGSCWMDEGVAIEVDVCGERGGMV
jgi:hypothetical protein